MKGINTFVIEVRIKETGNRVGRPAVVLSEMQNPYAVLVGWAKTQQITLFPSAWDHACPDTYLSITIEGNGDLEGQKTHPVLVIEVNRMQSVSIIN